MNNNFVASVIAQVCIIIGLPLMVVLGIVNCIHTWCLKQCHRVWHEPR